MIVRSDGLELSMSAGYNGRCQGSGKPHDISLGSIVGHRCQALKVTSQLPLAGYDLTVSAPNESLRTTTVSESNVKKQRETEREISQAIIRFEKEFMGRGPLETKTYIIDDIVLVRLKNVLTPAEIKLASADEQKRGRYLIKQMRQELIEQGRPLLDAVIHDILGIPVVSLHTDISARTGERIIVFTLKNQPKFVEA